MQYFVPIFEWWAKYNFGLFKYDLLAGITIASLAFPQGISYAKLANLPPIIGLYSSFVPPLIYAVFGSSKYLAVGTVAACSLLMAATIEEKASPTLNLPLYISLVHTATLISGLLQTTLGLLRLGVLVDFLSHSTITGIVGRNSNAYLSAATERHASVEALYNSYRYGFCYSCHYQQKK